MADAATADEPEVTDEEGGEEEGGKSKKKLIIMALGAVLLLGGAGGGAYFMGFFGGGGAEEEAAAPVIKSYYYDLPDIVVNLNALDDRSQYLKMKISLETHEEETLSALQPELPKILDSFQVYLRELRVNDIEGSGGLQRLKEELVRRINMAIYPAEISDVLFREIIVQ